MATSVSSLTRTGAVPREHRWCRSLRKSLPQCLPVSACRWGQMGWVSASAGEQNEGAAQAPRLFSPLLYQLSLKQERSLRQSSGRPAKSRPRNRHRNRHRASGARERWRRRTRSVARGSPQRSVDQRSPNSAPLCRAAVFFAGFRTELHHVHPSAQIDRHSLRHSVPEPATLFSGPVWLGSSVGRAAD